MRHPFLGYLLSCLCLIAVCTPEVSLAKPRAKPRVTSSSRTKFKRYVDDAVKAYKEERFEDAIASFEEALKLKAEYRLHWNLAVLYERVGRIELALTHVDEFLKDPKLKLKNRHKAEGRRAEMIRELEERRLKAIAQPDAPSQVSPQPSPHVETQVVEVERVNISEPIDQGRSTWGYWAIGGGLLGIGSLWAHLRADSIWEDGQEPSQSITKQEAQSLATTHSIIGDILLIGSLTSLSIAVWKWSDRPARTSTALKSSVHREQALIFTGQGLMWSGSF